MFAALIYLLIQLNTGRVSALELLCKHLGTHISPIKRKNFRLEIIFILCLRTHGIAIIFIHATADLVHLQELLL